jgi:hypothetical protein
MRPFFPNDFAYKITGLVASLNRPGGNITGVSLIASALDENKLGLLHELVPSASVIAGLINPNYPGAKTQADEVQDAASHLGVKPLALTATMDDEIDAAFASAVQQGAGAMLVSGDPFFNSRSGRFIAGGRPLFVACDLPAARICQRRGPHQLRTRLFRRLSQRRHLCRQDSQRCEPCRSAGDATDQIPAGHQSQDGQGTRHHRAVNAARYRR